MEETIKKIEKICNMRENLICDLEKEINKGIWSPECCGEAISEVVDMVKDLYEAEEKCWKSCYYKTIVHEMKSREHTERYGEPYGYDNWRYSSSGHYAPKGKGSYSPAGYDGMEEMMGEEVFYDPRIHGYSMPGSRSMGRSGNRGIGGAGESNRSVYGDAYMMYEDSRRHYTESKSSKDKKDMDTHAMEHLDDVVETTKEIMKYADSSLMRQMKTELTALVNDIPV